MRESSTVVCTKDGTCCNQPATGGCMLGQCQYAREYNTWEVRTLYSFGLPDGVFGHVIHRVTCPEGDEIAVARESIGRCLPDVTIHAYRVERDA